MAIVEYVTGNPAVTQSEIAAAIGKSLRSVKGEIMPTLNWIGKDKVVNHHQDVPFRVLDSKYDFGEPSDNMIIKGDNLHALKSLLPKYEGGIKCIYIDPPYNTGEEGWIYNDSVNDPKIRKWLGEVVGKEDEDLSRHDKWLCMMYPRLRLLHRLLAKDGSIFISVDDNEVANLRLICDEIFGAQNFVSSFIWEKRVNRENRKVVSARHDYIICYAKDNDHGKSAINPLPMTDEALARYGNPDDDPRGDWKSDPAHAQAGHATASQFYELTAPNGKKHNPPSGRCWLYTVPVMEQAIQDNRIWFGKSGNNVPRIKTFLYEKDRGLTPESLWFATDVSTNEKAKNALKQLFDGNAIFTTPKSVELIERILQIATKPNCIILDSFAGSGTTAHAVLNMNKADGGNRRFILVEMEDYAENITAERVRRVIDGYGDKEGTGGGFSFYELGEPLLFENGNLNESVSVDKIYKYVWYTETKSAYTSSDKPYNLGTKSGTAYYFYYERDAVTTLDIDFLRMLEKTAARHVIYADMCALSGADLERFSITFKKIPRDISKL